MKPSCKLFYVFVDYPEELHHLDNPDQVNLMKHLFIKALFTLPQFMTYLFDYEDMLPTSERLRTLEIHNKFTDFFYDILDDSLDEFNNVNLDYDSLVLGFDETFEMTGENYLAYESYYEYINAEIARYAQCTPNTVSADITNTVTQQLVEVIETLINEPVIRQLYIKTGEITNAITIQLKSARSLGLIFDISKLVDEPQPQESRMDTHQSIFCNYPETYQGNNKYVQELFNCHLSEFLDYIQNFHNYTYPPDIFTESYFNKVTYLVWTFLNSVDLVQTYTNILVELFRDVFLSVYEPIHDFIKDGMFIINSLTLAQGLFYAITIEKKLS